KGSSVHVEGSLKMDTWDDKNTGEKRSKIRVHAERVQFLDGRRGDSVSGNAGSAAEDEFAGSQEPPARKGGSTPPRAAASGSTEPRGRANGAGASDYPATGSTGSQDSSGVEDSAEDDVPF